MRLIGLCPTFPAETDTILPQLLDFFKYKRKILGDNSASLDKLSRNSITSDRLLLMESQSWYNMVPFSLTEVRKCIFYPDLFSL